MNRERPLSRGYGRPQTTEPMGIHPSRPPRDGESIYEAHANSRLEDDRARRERGEPTGPERGRGYGAPRDDYRDDYGPRSDYRDSRYDNRYGRPRGGRYSTFESVGRGGYGRGESLYDYGSLGGNGNAYESLLPPIPEQEIDEERRLKEAYERAEYTVAGIENQIYNLTGSVGSAIRDAMEKFKHPNGMREEDPVFAHFISDLKCHGSVYSHHVAKVICCALVDIIGDRAYKGGGRIPAEELFLKLEYITLRVLLLEFGNWLEGYHEGWGLVYRLSPQALQKLEMRDECIDMFLNTIKTVAIYCGGGAVDSLWRKNLLANVSRKAPSRSPTYDAYLEAMDYNFGEINTPCVRNSYYQDPPIHKGKDWDQSHWEAAQDIYHKPRRSVDGELTKMTDETYTKPDYLQPGWSYWAEEETSKAVTQKELVTLDNIHEFDLSGVDPSQWFKAVPHMTDTFVIRPSDLRVIANLLTFKGKNRSSYDVWISRILNRIPVVTLDWNTLSYDYVLVPVKDNKEMEMILTNPELVIPKLETRTEEEMVSDYRVYEASLEELEKQRKLAETDPNAVIELPHEPRVIYANAPQMFEQRKRMIPVMESLSTKADETYSGKISATVLPFIDCAEFRFHDIGHVDVSKYLPHLVEGNPFDFTFEEFINVTNSCFNSREMSTRGNWRDLKHHVDRYLTTVINRWLVEERYFAPFYGEKRYLGCDSILSQGRDLLEFLKLNDHQSYVALTNLSHNTFLTSRFQLFADAKTAGEFANKHAATVDEDMRDTIRDKILTESVIISAKGSVIRFNDIWPLDSDGPKMIQRSSSPEMFHVMDKVSIRAAKHFDSEMPVYFTFAKDPNAVIWMVTRSPFSRDKAMLVPISFDESLAMRKTIISEHIHTVED